ncbi:MAG: T9SS type A sorting domain-containing protein, partial [Bacteroidales bacterium]|nr:T9SS type A sorting domain-containing protein [Bacteroidales bacterium]
GQLTCKFMINTTNKDTMCKEVFISKGKDLEYVYQIPDKKGMRNYYRYYYHNIRDKESIPILNELLSMFNRFGAHDFYLADSIDIDYYDTSNSQYVVHNKIYFEYLSNNLLQKCIQKEYISNNIKTMDMVYDSENNYVGIEVSISIPDSCSDNYMNLSQSVNENNQLTEILLMPYYNPCSNRPDFHGTKVTYLYNENKDLELEVMYLGDDLGNWNIYMKRYYTYNTSRIASVKEVDIQVFPNPANTQLTLDNKDALIKEAHIYDITGKEVSHHSINANQSTLDISTLKSGLYIVKIHTEQGVLNRKVQVVK